MASITPIAGTDIVSDSRSVINTNFANLNSAKLESSDVAIFLTETEADALYSPLEHDHVISDVTGLQDELDDKQPIATVLTNTTASFTTTLKDKLDGIAAGAEVNAVDSVNGQTGTVALDADDIDDSATTKKFTTASDISKLAGIAAGAEVNVQSDWNATDGDAFIQNKPTLFSGSYDDLTDKPTLGDLAALDTITNTEVEDAALSIAKVSGLQTALDGKLVAADLAPYYTETEVDNLLDDRQPLATVLTNTTAAFTTEQASKLAGIEAGAEVNTVDSVNGQTGTVVLDAGDVGLGNVDNTSDVNKPVSTATQTALNAKAAVSQTGGITMTIGGEVANGNYLVFLKLPFAGTITETTTKSAAGTATATFKINTTALGGTANSASTSEQSQSHSSANAFTANDDIVVTVSSASGLEDLTLSLKYTRTLA